jgi:glycosyltransferase involved in cell wall biosynthesis
MVVDNDVQRDPRVRKEARSLATAGYRVVVVGVSRSGPVPPAEETVSGYRIERVISRLGRDRVGGKPGHLVRTVEGFVRAAWRLRSVNARTCHAHDFMGLLIAALAGIPGRSLVYDTHELFFERPLPAITRRLRWLLRPLERFLARRARCVITVSEGCANYFTERYGVARAVVVRNVMDADEVSEQAVPFEAPARHMVAHSGWLSPERHLEELVGSLAHLPATVGLVLVGGGRLEPALRARAESLGVSDRLVTLGVVETGQIVPTLRQATVAAVLIEPRYESYRRSLPNKFFEAVAAGLPLVVGAIPEVKRLVEAYDIGVVCDPSDPRSIADAVKRVLEPDMLARMGPNVRRARQELSWASEAGKMIALYRDALQG